MKRKNPHSRSGVAMIIALSAIIGLLAACNRFQSGIFNFQEHDRKYFAEIALACSELLSQTNGVPSEETIRGNDKSLPAPLLNLHATTIKATRHLQVGTNYLSGVVIIFGEGRPDYTVTWLQNDYGNGYKPWELSANGDGVYSVVFSITNSP